MVFAARGPAGQGVVDGGEQVAHRGDLLVAGVGVCVGGREELADAPAHLGDRVGHELKDVRAAEGLAALRSVGGAAGDEGPVHDGKGRQDGVVEELFDDGDGDARVGGPVVHDGRDDLGAGGRVRGADVDEAALCAVDACEHVAQ